jgi:ribose 1,5-bisphosphokinase
MDRPADPPSLPGCLVLVVGPSGAGKDSLIDRARARLHGRNDLLFPARLVTRSAHAAEDNVPVSPETFHARREAGAFALHWEAHGLGYGIPSIIDEALALGRTVVVNVSRTVVEEARGRYPRVQVVLIDAPLHVRAERLARRGREEAAAIAARLAREVAGGAPAADLTIVNDGSLEEGARRLAAAIETAAGARKPESGLAPDLSLPEREIAPVPPPR